MCSDTCVPLASNVKMYMMWQKDLDIGETWNKHWIMALPMEIQEEYITLKIYDLLLYILDCARTVSWMCPTMYKPREIQILFTETV